MFVISLDIDKENQCNHSGHMALNSCLSVSLISWSEPQRRKSASPPAGSSRWQFKPYRKTQWKFKPENFIVESFQSCLLKITIIKKRWNVYPCKEVLKRRGTELSSWHIQVKNDNVNYYFMFIFKRQKRSWRPQQYIHI